jgi:hypothetical protein
MISAKAFRSPVRLHHPAILAVFCAFAFSPAREIWLEAGSVPGTDPGGYPGPSPDPAPDPDPVLPPGPQPPGPDPGFPDSPIVPQPVTI